MSNALKALFENNVFSEDTKRGIEEAWQQHLSEHRTEITQQLREEYAQKYEHDRQAMIEAIESMVTENLADEIKEFKIDRDSLREAKAKNAVKLHEHMDKISKFVMQNLTSELREYREERKAIEQQMANLEHFVMEALTSELVEFQQDKRDLAESKVRLIKEGKQELARAKRTFLKRSSKLVESVVSTGLSREISHLKSDIEQARRNDFGRRIMEAFTAEYQHSFLNERSETAKLLKVIASKDRELAESKKALVEKTKLVESASRAAASAKDLAERRGIMADLLSPLNTQQRGIMQDLLESVQTNRLRSSFSKYLPSVLNENAGKVTKPILTEMSEAVGGRKSSPDVDGEVTDILRLAGI